MCSHHVGGWLLWGGVCHQQLAGLGVVPLLHVPLASGKIRLPCLPPCHQSGHRIHRMGLLGAGGVNSPALGVLNSPASCGYGRVDYGTTAIVVW